MKSKSGSFISKRKEIKDLKKQLISIREENRKLKDASFNGDKNKKIKSKVILRNRVVLIFKSTVNSFRSRSKRIQLLYKEIESLKRENITLQLEKQAISKMWSQLSASFHSQGSVDRAMR